MSLVAVALPQVEAFLDAAANHVGLGGLGYQQRVKDRLDESRGKYGDRSFQFTLEQVTERLAIEAADLGGWSVVALLSDELAELDEDKRVAVLQLVQAITAEGVRTAFLVHELQRTLEE